MQQKFTGQIENVSEPSPDNLEHLRYDSHKSLKSENANRLTYSYDTPKKFLKYRWKILKE